MHLPVNPQTSLLAEFDDENDARTGTGSGQAGDDAAAMSRGNGGCIRDRPVKVIPCPRCQSMNTKFCYYNNYSVAQPRHFCRNCQRYWTVGGTLRNVPVGGGSRKKTRTRSRSDSYLPTYDTSPQTSPAGSQCDGLLTSASSCMQQLSMLPPPPGFASHLGGFATAAASQLPFLQSALEGLYPRKQLAGLQEVPDLQTSLYDTPQVPQRAPMFHSPSVLMNGGFFTPESFQVATSQHEPLVAVMAKAGLWSNPIQTLAGANVQAPELWEERQGKASVTTQLGQGGYGVDRRNLTQVATVLPQNSKPGFWDATSLMHSRLVMDDRLVPHASWNENRSTTHTNLSPNGSSTTDHSTPHQSFSHGYEDVSQPWVGLHAADILF